MPYEIAQYGGPDDQLPSVIRGDFSGGANTRQHGTIISEKQGTKVDNADIAIPGRLPKRLGTSLIEDLGDNDAGTGAIGFEPVGGTEELIVTHGQKVEGYVGSGTFTEHKTDITTDGAQTKLLQVWKSGGDGSVLLLSNGTDNIEEMNQSHTFTTLTDDSDDAPPKGSIAMEWFRGRLWILKDNEAFFSDAYPSNFATSFNQATNVYNIPVGDERAIIALRESGLIFLGSEAIYGMNPSSIPSPFDKLEKLLDIGCVASKTAIMVGDDIYFLARDGVRGLFRTINDKIQLGRSEPISYVLKDEYDNINWSQISKATAMWADNKYWIALPTGTSTYNNQVWVYHPAQNAWSVIKGWNVGDWARVTFSGQEKTYYIGGDDDSVFQSNKPETYGDNTANVVYQVRTRHENLGFPYQYKVGGEVGITCAVGGNYGTITVKVNLDDAGFTNLGTLDTGTAGVSFPADFPLNFGAEGTVTEKFHLENSGRWKTLQIEFYNDSTSNVELLTYLIRTHLEEYMPEVD